MTDSIVRLGVDAGTLTLKLVGLGPGGDRVFAKVSLHRGDPFGTFRAMIGDLDVSGPIRVAVSGSLANTIADRIDVEALESTAALRREILSVLPGVRNVIDIGAGSVSLMILGTDGTLRGYQTNTLCAAGTGSFLDEQAERLGLDVAALAGEGVVDDPPSIAARCAVFAKSDLIHRQQEGYGKRACWSGLCRGLVRNIVSTLCKGRRLEGRTALVGGVALNTEVVRWFSDDVGAIVIPGEPQFVQATGAAREARSLIDFTSIGDGKISGDVGTARQRRLPLALRRSQYPELDEEAAYVDDHGTEVRVIDWKAGGRIDVVMGLDIGSTSTKALFIDRSGRVIADFYRKTEGDPIGATKKIFQAVRDAASERRSDLSVMGVGTTGSGRKLIGTLVGADRVINEITAHLAGAIEEDPGVDTIFEIGGQDAKFIHARDSRLRDSNMNYVCAAGTGSFVEEQARKLGFDIRTVGEKVMGIAAPVTSDRCTVFMEQDVAALIRDGFSKTEAMASVLYSVAQNYLDKVVGKRPVSKNRIFFQGATARNKALVAAFENLLGVEVVVSPLCHVMGCYGLALITLRQMDETGEASGFVGLDFVDREVVLNQETCDLCTNSCSITFADVEGRRARPSWGYLCGRDPEDGRVKANRGYRFFQRREKCWDAGERLPARDGAPRIGIPRALVQHTYLPMWQSFLEALGFEVVLSGATSRETVARSDRWVGADYCFPVKIAHGHVRELIEDQDLDRIFVPHMISAPESRNETTQTHFCPYNIAIPSMVRSAIGLHGGVVDCVVSPIVDLRWSRERMARRLAEDLVPSLGVTRRAVNKAWGEALRAQSAYEDALKDLGRQALGEVEAEDRPGVVVLGRPYNVYDEGSNLALPRKMAGLGFMVLPIELLPLDDVDLGPEFRNMFWDYGRKILEAARYIASSPNLFAIYFSNFSCGPDGFLQTYVEEIMGDKPMLMIELDEHGADAGYMTRLEAFADVLVEAGRVEAKRFSITPPPSEKAALAGKTLWLPPMHPVTSGLLAASFRDAGYNAREMPPETPTSFRIGKDLCGGNECLPCPATLGSFIEAVRSEGGDPAGHALFMATAEGPCRFGQYATLQRIMLDRVGWTSMPIVSWSSDDTYDGLDMRARRKAWWAIVLGDLLLKTVVRTRPYEVEAGAAERALAVSKAEIAAALERGCKPVDEVARAVERFGRIETVRDARPLVGIVGEIYVRGNTFCNQDLIGTIEEAGGEAWLAPTSEWFLYTAHMENILRGNRSGLRERIRARIRNRFLAEDEKYWTEIFDLVLADRREPNIASTIEAGGRFLPLEFEGEAVLSLGRAAEFIADGAAMVVNAAPFGCMVGSLTAGIFQQMEQETGVPVVSMFYDGETDLSSRIRVFLANRIETEGESEAPPVLESSTPGLASKQCAKG